jgi:hypothetical protein
MGAFFYYMPDQLHGGIMKKHLTFLLSGMLSLVGCSGFMYRTHEEKMTQETPFWSPGEDFPVMSGDTGKVRESYDDIRARTPSSEKSKQIQREQILTIQEIESFEAELNEEELEDLKRLAPLFDTPEQKLYYFRLTKSEQANYIELLRDGQIKQVPKSNAFKEESPLPTASKDHWSFLRPKIEEITTGMEKAQVMQRWGSPTQVAVAGDPVHENERWSFHHGRQRRIVYFEHGVVVGWEQF